MKLSAVFLSAAASTLLAHGACAQTAASAGARSGEQVYKSVCIACHATGVVNAPKVGDRKAWAPLISEGQAVLTAHAWVGVRAMPARGGSPDLSLPDFAKAVAYMASQSGGDWKDPDAALMRKMAQEADRRLGKSIKDQQAMQRDLQQWIK